ncbi:hypothetical protein F0562_001407 [Nyssa sinensis]|uniref:Retrotransposon Copia-like N-terminal domain-containing protein n=1 Tax=Nyssa sinensis TaxID=561372 RepID=A0A5J5C2J0_9ASTE|nr:hypothetical protein F0562_001407 [Nyssa sinensis]
MVGDGKDGDKSTLSVVLSDDPFSINHSDNPTIVLVSPPLNRDNYGSWRRAITMALRAKNKIGIVDGFIEQRNQDKVNKVSQWERYTDLVGSWILNFVSDEIRSSILYANTVRAIWTDLPEHFSQSNARLYDRIAAIRSQILLMEPFPSVVKMYSLVRQEEKQQEIHSLSCHVPNAVALNTAVKSNNFYPNRIVTGSNRPSPGGENRPSSSNRKPKYHCDHCG